MPTCPNGHASTSADYCDTCGAPIPAGAAPDPVAAAPLTPSAPSASAVKTCPNCHAANPNSALFCEACGYDFTTGSLPRMSELAAAAAPVANPLDLGLDAPAPPAPASLDVEDAPATPVAPVPAPSLDEPQGSVEEASLVDEAPAGTASPQEEQIVDADVLPDAVEPVVEPLTPPAPDAAAPVTPPAPASAPEVPAAPVSSGVPVLAPVEVAPSGPVEWVAEAWIDPDWYAGQDSPDQIPSPGLPRVIGLRKKASLIGRPSRSRGIAPDVDCEPDTGVSRRHAELSTDGTRWWIEDLGSSNGTFVGQAGAALPSEPIKGRTELDGDARVYVGSWTRIVVRRADPGEAEL